MASILVAWIGASDAKASEPGTVVQSRINQVVANEFYSTVMLLSARGKKESRAFRKWLAARSGVNVELDRRKLNSEYVLTEVYDTTVSALEECRARYEDEEVEFSFLLGADSPIMDAVLILLAHTRYAAELIHWTEASGTLPLELPSGDVLALLQGQVPGQAMRRSISDTANFDAFVHRSDAMSEVLDRATRMAMVDVPSIITGEGGTGRELLARAIHKASTRSSGPFVPFVCGAMGVRDQEAALFGTDGHPGALERADGGTLYLEGLEQLHPSLQTAVYQVLREGKVPFGGAEDPEVSVRIIAATAINVRQLVPSGAVQDGLFNELAIGIIEIPPLRERGGDIDLIVDELLKSVNQEMGQTRTISDEARNRIRRHQWPGNVGELKAVLRRAAVWADEEIQAEHIESSILPVTVKTQGDSVLDRPLDEVNIHELLDEVSRHYLQRALDSTDGNKTKAASMLGLNNYQTLTNWMSRLQMS